ncbi:hypothetical protein SAMN05216455_1022 [Segatella bryantii]|jgi:hypothetical protein|uniref:hypothetical protein n=1 Tax=Segatella bryantii TaxID=77095 RepID=UPI00089661B6|nr:hypothetical protein [Segatella bryantii]SDZ94025.1 hypothetical protein SAMN05216455_1022 [Segatella bryantii]
MQQKSVDPQVYYQNLSKKDKGKFLRYLSRQFDYPSSTMSAKLRENAISDLRKDERDNIIKTIEEGLWKM